MAARKVERIHPALREGRKVVHVFSELGYELTALASYRHKSLRVGRVLDDDEWDELRFAAREWERTVHQRRAARAEHNAAARPSAGEITAIEPGRQGRLFVALDGRYAFTTTLSLATEHELVVGRRLAEPEVMLLRGAYASARVAAMIDSLTAYRPRSAGEVRRRLTAKGVDGDTVEEALRMRLGSAMGVLEDDEFVDWFAEHRGVARGKNFGVLVGELRRLGVADAAIDAARDRFERDDALSLALDKSSRGLNLSDERDQRRFVNRLLSRGFSYGDARDYIDNHSHLNQATLAESYKE